MFQGIELVYVIHGSLTSTINANKNLLHAADILWIDGGAKRQYRCHGNTPAKALIITIPKLSMNQFKAQHTTLAVVS